MADMISPDTLKHQRSIYEPFISLFLATHGILTLIFVYDNSTLVSWCVLASVLALSISGFLRRTYWPGQLEKPSILSAHAVFLLLCSWLLMYFNGGLSSFFTIWMQVIVVAYPIFIGNKSAFLIPAVFTVLYGSLIIITKANLPATVIAQRFLVFSGSSLLVTAFELQAQRLLKRQNLLLQKVSKANELALKAMGTSLEYRDDTVKGHTDRVTALAVALGKHLGLSAEQLDQLRWGAYLHDIGKVSISDAILRKPAKLTDTEFTIIKNHVIAGELMVRSLDFLPEPTVLLVRHHHERWDGNGYPDGLKGNDIPLLARVFSVVDVYDALVSERPYKPCWTHKEALAEIVQQKNLHFDPHIVDAFVELLELIAAPSSGVVVDPEVILGDTWFDRP